MNRSTGSSGRVQTAWLGVAAVALVAMIVAYPDLAFDASLSGLTVWWEFVFPALLPFLILSELLIGFGLVHALGVLLEPLMRLLFRLPGAGGWAMAMSFSAGYPSGAKAAADLRRDGAIGRADGERLVALSHLSSPIFLTSVVAVGFLGHPELGLPLVAIHLVSALLTGVLIGRRPFLGKAEEAPPPNMPPSYAPDAQRLDADPRRGWAKVVGAMADAHRKDGRPLGRLLGDAVASAVQTLLSIGGLMIVFSVLVKLLSIVGVTDVVRRCLQLVLMPLGMPGTLADGAVTALFEVHLGAYALAAQGDVTVWGAAMLSAVVAWGGLSVHAQVKSFLFGTDLRYTPFLIARLTHAALAAAVSFMLWEPLQRWSRMAAPAFAGTRDDGVAAAAGGWAPWTLWLSAAQQLGFFLLGALALSAAALAIRRAARTVRS
ncbi:hypothetical protein MO973_02410 [Paenibacillus sp. TRM 82003]|nr:hypothetical protein [Paenibacillus sp. TRM 82003]